MPLESQIRILSVDTGNFYYDDEAELHERNRFVRTERRKLINGYNEKQEDGTTIYHKGKNELLSELKNFRYTEKEVNKICKQDDLTFSNFESNVKDLLLLYSSTVEKINKYAEEAKNTKQQLLSLLEDRVEYNISQTNEPDKHIRELREETILSKDGNIKDNNIISVFESSFTRMIGAKENELCEDFMVIQVYYFSVIKDIIYNGFYYKGEKYIYFTSSAGQIRTKKCVFIKESIWNKYEKTLMCGLTLDKINEKGGNNPTKHLAYMALSNSATDEWKEFDIDKTIVVEDFETNVFGTYDLVDDVDYSITRKSDYIPIPHMDGCGIYLPNAFGMKQKNMMVRLPFVKGLLGVFDFKKFINVNNCSPIVKDIYGIEHDVISEDIQVIFTKSQTKLWKYYDSWEQYKEYFKKYNCTANYTNVEEEKIDNATINYQMLQSLTDITDEEVLEIAKDSINNINDICSSIDVIKRVFGATLYNLNKTSFQKSICIYPQLLNDVYVRRKLKEVKDSMIKSYKSGKLQVNGKYTFILPDLYAFCEWLFKGEENPKGLLDDGEVFCWLFRKDNKLDCLRSPHLYMEHPIRYNIACNDYSDRQKGLREWFVTDAIYISTHDIITKIIMADCDGDKALVIANKTLIEVAERNIKKFDVVPLYYNMRKANPCILNNESIYNGLNSAFTGSNIGIYSNNISKIWNNDVFINGSFEEQKEAINMIKWLCMENNFKIDYAKCLYMPERPDYVKDLITSFTNNPLPHFFKYAKDKSDEQVEDINDSFVNKLSNVIPNTRISCKYIDDDGNGRRLLRPIGFLMMNDENLLLNDTHKEIIDKYLELAKKFYFKIDFMSISKLHGDVLKNSQIKQNIIFNSIVNDTRNELLSFGFDEVEVTDILVKYLYDEKESKYKDMLWVCFGETIYNNLLKHKSQKQYNKMFNNKTRAIRCNDCGEWFEITPNSNKVSRCPSCQLIAKKEFAKLRKRKQRAKEKENIICHT